jgi:long-chain-fatty-acid--CoA ligase ACSBG
LPIKVRQFGPGSEPPLTLSDVFKRTTAKQGDKPAFYIERQGKVLSWTWNQYYKESEAFAKSMHAVGVQERKGVNIVGHNSPEWVIAFMGGILSNCIVSGVYPTNNVEACLYQADHSEAEIVIVDSIEQLKKYQVNLPKLPNIKAIVVYTLDKLPAELTDKKFFVWKDFLVLGKDVKTEIINEKVKRQKPGKCTVLIYTSGTTGNPKACMLSHDNLVWTVKQANTMLSSAGEVFSEEERIVSYLPLSHVAGLVLDVISHVEMGHKLYFAKPDALQGTLVQTLIWAKPTYFLAVPRIWEKMEEKLKEIGASKGSIL